MYNVNYKKGFTLIELLVVIAIIGVLASVVIISLDSARVKSRDVTRVAQVKQLKNAMELYRNDNRAYVNQCDSYVYERTELNTYIKSLPVDPTYNNTLSDYRYCGATDVNNSGPGYGIRIRFEDTSRPGTDANGFCKTGVNMSSSWWGVATPVCEGL